MMVQASCSSNWASLVAVAQLQECASLELGLALCYAAARNCCMYHGIVLVEGGPKGLVSALLHGEWMVCCTQPQQIQWLAPAGYNSIYANNATAAHRESTPNSLMKHAGELKPCKAHSSHMCQTHFPLHH